MENKNVKRITRIVPLAAMALSLIFIAVSLIWGNLSGSLSQLMNMPFISTSTDGTSAGILILPQLPIVMSFIVFVWGLVSAIRSFKKSAVEED